MGVLRKIALAGAISPLLTLAFAGVAVADRPAAIIFVKPDTPADAMVGDQIACEADARHSRVVTYANVSIPSQYNQSIASPLALLVVGAMVDGRGARATQDDFVRNCMSALGYVGVPLQSREASAYRRARDAEARLAWAQTFYSSAAFAERVQQANAQNAQPAPGALQSSWVFGEVMTPEGGVKHFELGPNDVEEITTSRLLPAVLVTLDQTVVSGARGDLRVEQGDQLFQLSAQSRPTFCTLAPIAGRNYVCLIDLDSDAMVDTLVLARSSTPSLPLLELDPDSAAALASPAALRTLAPEDCTCSMSVTLIHWGRRSMGRRDAGFTMNISRRDVQEEPAAGPMFSLVFDELPESLDILGARFDNISREDRVLRFDLSSGFERGAFYDPYYGGNYVEWGF
jgi:hypothetical protein